MKSPPRLPSSLNIQEILSFSPEIGQVKLGQERMLLFSQTSVGLLRSLMHTQLGPEMSRMLLAQFGHQHGADDFKSLMGMFSWESEKDRLAAGPIMHALSGIVRVEPTLMEMDRETGHFHFRGLWHHSYEAEIYKKSFGLSHEPVCYSLAGYGSGWCSAFFGIPLLEIEHRCVARGDDVCEWEIKPWDAWGPEADPWKKSLTSSSESVYQDLLASHRKIIDLNQNLEKEIERRTAENRRLLRMICHDVRVPMDTIKQSVAKLDTASIDRGTGTSHNDLARCVDMVQAMLNQVRDAEAQSSGKIIPRHEAFSLGDGISTVQMVYRSHLLAKKINFNIKNSLGPKDLLWVPPTVFTANILSNVLANAIKFSPRDATIYFEARREGEEILISVRDEGIGIPERLRPHLFSNHIPTSRPGTYGEVGTGFGLPIVKSYVEAIGGRIEIESRTRDEDPIHHGTTVHLSLKRAKIASREEVL